MFWIVAGIVLVVVLLLAWSYDRVWGGDPTTPPSRARGQAESDQAWTVHQGGGGTGGT